MASQITSFADYNKKATCPYNSSHVVKRERLEVHLLKCAKNYPEIIMQKCPFNYTHLFRHPKDLNKHLLSCEDKVLWDVNKCNIPIRQQENEVEPVFVTPTYISEENWDDDDDHPTYDPQQYVQNNRVLLKSAPRSVRKGFGEAKRRRFNNMPKKD